MGLIHAISSATIAVCVLSVGSRAAPSSNTVPARNLPVANRQTFIPRNLREHKVADNAEERAPLPEAAEAVTSSVKAIADKTKNDAILKRLDTIPIGVGLLDFQNMSPSEIDVDIAEEVATVVNGIAEEKENNAFLEELHTLPTDEGLLKLLKGQPKKNVVEMDLETKTDEYSQDDLFEEIESIRYPTAMEPEAKPISVDAKKALDDAKAKFVKSVYVTKEVWNELKVAVKYAYPDCRTTFEAFRAYNDAEVLKILDTAKAYKSVRESGILGKELKWWNEQKQPKDFFEEMLTPTGKQIYDSKEKSWQKWMRVTNDKTTIYNVLMNIYNDGDLVKFIFGKVPKAIPENTPDASSYDKSYRKFGKLGLDKVETNPLGRFELVCWTHYMGTLIGESIIKERIPMRKFFPYDDKKLVNMIYDSSRRQPKTEFKSALLDELMKEWADAKKTVENVFRLLSVCSEDSKVVFDGLRLSTWLKYAKMIHPDEHAQSAAVMKVLHKKVGTNKKINQELSGVAAGDALKIRRWMNKLQKRERTETPSTRKRKRPNDAPN